MKHCETMGFEMNYKVIMCLIKLKQPKAIYMIYK